MSLTWSIVFSLLGTGSLVFICYALFTLITKPYEFIKLNYTNGNSNVLYKYLMLLAPPLVLCFGMYHVVYFLLGWMPADWGAFKEDGFVTIRSSLSTTLGGMIGLFLTSAIGKGIVAQTHLSTRKLEVYLNDRIKSVHSSGLLKELKERFEIIIAGDSVFSKDKELYDAIKMSCLPDEVVRESLYDAVKTIQHKLNY